LFSSKTGLWKIGDFGFSSEATSKHSKLTRYSRGTSSYRSPELLSEHPTYTNRADIWALGCIVYEIYILGSKAFFDDYVVREYGACQELPLKIQVNILLLGKVGESLREIFSIDPSKRPSARSLLEVWAKIKENNETAYTNVVTEQ